MQADYEEEAQVVLHCRLYSSYDTKLRIWSSTFLFDCHTDHKSKLVHADNISLFPDWTDVPAGKYFHFTLIFSALPRCCTLFNFIESIPEPGGFSHTNIERNKSDVYYIEIT